MKNFVVSHKIILTVADKFVLGRIILLTRAFSELKLGNMLVNIIDIMLAV